MNGISGMSIQKFFPRVLVGLMIALTVGTSAVGITKVAASSFGQKPNPEVAKQEEANDESQQNTSSPQVAGQVKSATTTNVTASANGNKPDASPSPATGQANGSSSSTPKPSASPANVVSSRVGVSSAASANSTVTASVGQPAPATGGCIITLFGKQYDVASLRSTHPGGDVFACGTDMTAAYQRQHGTDVSRMQAYLVTASPSQQPSPTTGGMSGGQSGSGSQTGQPGSGMQSGQTGIQNGSNQVSQASGNSHGDDDDDDNEEEDHESGQDDD